MLIISNSTYMKTSTLFKGFLLSTLVHNEILLVLQNVMHCKSVNIFSIAILDFSLLLFELCDSKSFHSSCIKLPHGFFSILHTLYEVIARSTIATAFAVAPSHS